jgi:mercuric ion transport protein
MTAPTRRPAGGHLHVAATVDNAPPARTKVTGALAALACAACCAIPFLIGAGVVTGAGATLLRNGLLAGSALMAVAALGMWWLHRRRSQLRAAAAGRSGCGTAGCDC